ncbi:EAL domain-containing protein [Lusitaniella coriacea LEGE 07157]|uniref:EAL domain-containing protein n=1 Tax=Lusitaniella coriacea LEGE 07157 TaxID=945747 RepID=A0A8J7AS06_9CYAN|nr:EAL domain-containing protein [Lusitaniella coriacea]MBE9115181.1 EAL domain-containing protein [Lusitaniella coriacea LEGE 07157]
MNASRILVVDDESLLEYLILQKFRRQIRNNRYQFVFASNGVNALEKIQQEDTFDMILTDLRMPEMDGLTLLEKLRKIDKNIKTVVVSAYGDMQNLRAAMNRGAFDFLVKPVDLQDLEKTIKKTLEHINTNKLQQAQLQKAQEKVQYLAFNDALTDLVNRNFFMQTLKKTIATNSTKTDRLYAVLFLDLDRFKIVNDSLGHTIGDRLLQNVANKLKECSHSNNIVARFGGDEFAILLDNIQDSSEATHLAQRIQTALEQPVQIENYKIYITASIGISLSSIRYEKVEDVIRDADVAMYRAKDQEKSRYAIFDPSMQAMVAERLQLEGDLRKALDNQEFYDRNRPQEFYNHYQPIVSLKTGKIVGFEVLVRWNHPQQGTISPLKFIPIAEETQLIDRLGWWIFQEGCAQLKRWKEEFPHLFFCLNINVSAIQLKQVDFSQKCQEILQSFSLEGSRLKLELTESCLLEDLPKQIAQLSEIKAIQVQLCIDDFGTGYSSLSRLHEFPIDTLKIDRSFIHRMTSSTGHYATVEMIVALAHTLNLNVVAEGIETGEELESLIKLGCEFGQGYLFSRPLDSQAATEFLRKNLNPKT